MKKNIILCCFFIVISCQEKQLEKSILNDCLSTKQVNLLNDMISSFENDVCKYYNLQKDESDKAIRNYLKEIKTKGVNSTEEVFIVLKIASDKSKELFKKSFDILSDDVWITFEEENNPNRIINQYGQNAFKRFIKEMDTVGEEVDMDDFLEDDFEIDEIPILEKEEVLNDKLLKDSLDREKRIKKYKNALFLRIYGKLVDCVYSKTTNESARKFYDALLKSGRMHPDIYIVAILNLSSEDFNSNEIKTYIALGLFYSQLDFELK